MKQRLFVAIVIPGELKKSILQWQKRNDKLPVRFIKRNDLHLTVIPPWYADPKKVAKKIASFTPSVKPFSLHFEKVLLRPRLIWVKGKSSKKLTTLRRELTRLLEVKTERRPITPHVTLARYKDIAQAIPEESVHWDMRVRTFVLMKSTLTSKGAHYDVLARFPLVK